MIVALPMLALVAVHVAMAMRMRLPIVFSDEIAYLAHARFFAGAGWPIDFAGGSAYFNFGYSLFIAPLFRIWSDPMRVYTAIAVVNGVVLSLLYLPLYLWCRRVLERPRGIACAIAFVTCLYPAFVLQSNIAWTESLVIPLYALLVLAWHRHVERLSVGSALAVSALATALYVVHPRGLPILGLVLALFALQAVRRRLSWPAFAVAAATAMTAVLAAHHVDTVLRHVEWGDTGDKPLSQLLASLGSIAGVGHDLLGLCGELWYLVVATGGLFVLGALFVAQQARGSDARAQTARFVLLTAGCILAATVLNMEYALRVEGMRNLDYLVCGRHNETFLPIFLACGLERLWARRGAARLFDRSAAAVVAAVVLLGFVLRLGRGAALMTTHPVGTGILGILPLVHQLGGVDVLRISLLALAVALVVLVTARRHPLPGVAVIAAAFVGLTVLGWRFVTSEQRNVAVVATLPARVTRAGGADAIGYDMAAVNWPRYWTYQFLLPATRFVRFDSRRDPPPATPLVIASGDWPQAIAAGATFVAEEPTVDQTLWALPSFVAAHHVGPDPFATIFGVAALSGVRERGFHGAETIGTVPVRWTDGRARVDIPVAGVIPRVLKIVLASTGRGTRLAVRANGRTLRDEEVAVGRWSAELPLDDVERRHMLSVEVASESFVPHELSAASPDRRRLGVQVEAIELLP